MRPRSLLMLDPATAHAVATLPLPSQRPGVIVANARVFRSRRPVPLNPHFQACDPIYLQSTGALSARIPNPSPRSLVDDGAAVIHNMSRYRNPSECNWAHSHRNTSGRRMRQLAPNVPTEREKAAASDRKTHTQTLRYIHTRQRAAIHSPATCQRVRIAPDPSDTRGPSGSTLATPCGS